MVARSLLLLRVDAQKRNEPAYLVLSQLMGYEEPLKEVDGVLRCMCERLNINDGID